MTDRPKLKRLISASKDLTFEILRDIHESADVIFSGSTRELFIASSGGYAAVAEMRYAQKMKELNARVRQLKYRKLLEVRKTGGELIYELTKKGKEAYLREALRRSPLRADGKIVMLIFDIPEQAHRSRQVLRYFLRTSGFVMIQKSVWASKQDVTDILYQWLEHSDFRKWIRVFIAEGR